MADRQTIIELARKYPAPLDRARRIFLEEPSFALEGKRELEFEIKTIISDHYSVPFRAVVFCGSGHLGFSPHKDSAFKPSISDLDVAVVNTEVFQRIWMMIISATRAFTDLRGFQIHTRPAETANKVREMMVKRGLFHLDQMPRCDYFDSERKFFDALSVKHRSMFSRVSVSFYMNEYAFCWKQNSSIQEILG